MQSIFHDILTADRERDYQSLGMFLLPSIWKYLALEVETAGIEPQRGACFHTYPACPAANETVIFSISYQGHMMRGKPTAATTSATWGDWRGNISGGVGEVIHIAIPWKQRTLDGAKSTRETPMSILKPCNRCGLKIKVGLTRLSVGHSSVWATTVATQKSRWAADGRKRDRDRTGRAGGRTRNGGCRLLGTDSRRGAHGRRKRVPFNRSGLAATFDTRAGSGAVHGVVSEAGSLPNRRFATRPNICDADSAKGRRIGASFSTNTTDTFSRTQVF